MINNLSDPDKVYLETMRAHVDEGGKLTHVNAVYLLGIVESIFKDEERRIVLSNNALEAVVADVIRDVAELEDRSSPSDDPSLMLVRDYELEEILRHCLERTNLSADAPAQQPQISDEAVEVALTKWYGNGPAK